MIVVTGKIVVAPEDVDAAIAAVKDMVAETVREDGCHVYEFSRVIGSENVFRVYEEWADLTALEAHFRTTHMAVFRERLAGLTILSRAISRYEAGRREAL
jgi:quinol monooxygenase YgiN